MKRLFQYFELNRTEQRGFIALSIVILFVLVMPLAIELFKKDDYILADYHVRYLDVLSTDEHQGLDRDNAISIADDLSPPGRRVNTISYFEFDPNSLPVHKWKQLGFSDKQIAVIENYKAKGGKFYKKEDLAKIYSISASEYARIAPYVKITATKEKPGADNDPNASVVTRRAEKPLTVKLTIDINLADTADFKQLKGVGTVLSNRIVKYREALGGFHNISQVGEVYGISAEVFDAIQNQLTYDVNHKVVKLAVNKLSKAALAKHPYISGKQAQLIENYRDQHGAYTNIDDLRKIILLDSDFLRKIEPYLQF